MSAMGMGNREWGIAGAACGGPVVRALAMGWAFAFAPANPDSRFPIPGFSAAQRRKS